MTTENQIAIAEACGWTRKRDGSEFWQSPNKADTYPYSEEEVCASFNSLDFIQQAVLAQDEEFQEIFNSKLMAKDLRQGKLVHQLTITDWQESFVETLKQLGRLK